MQAVVLAAGKGSRLGKITEYRSKAMLPIAGKPIIARVIDQISSAGITEFIIVIRPDDKTIINSLPNHLNRSLKIKFVVQTKARGMADALQSAKDFIEGDFILSACDNLTSTQHIQELIQMHQLNRFADATLSIMSVDQAQVSNTGIVELDKNIITRIIEKPSPEKAPSNIASLPLYIFSTKIFRVLDSLSISPRGEYELQDAIQALIDDHKFVQGFMTDSRKTITTVDDLLQVNKDYLNQSNFKSINNVNAIGKNTKFIVPFLIESGTNIGEHCVIGPNVYLEGNCFIGSNAKISNSLVLAGGNVKPGTIIKNKVVL